MACGKHLRAFGDIFASAAYMLTRRWHQLTQNLLLQITLCKLHLLLHYHSIQPLWHNRAGGNTHTAARRHSVGKGMTSQRYTRHI